MIRRARVNRAPEVKEVSVRASGLEETYDGRTDKKKPKAVIVASVESEPVEG